MRALGVLMSQGGRAFIPAAHLCILQILALNPHLPGSWSVGSSLPHPHQHHLSPWQAPPWVLLTEGWERDSYAHGRPHFLLLFSDLPAWHNKSVRHVLAQLRAGMKIHIYLGHRLDLQDGLLLKREENRNQASLTKYNRQISFLNILSDLDCRSQGGNKKYLFCNPALL